MSPIHLKHLYHKHNAYYYVRRQGGKVVWTRLAAVLEPKDAPVVGPVSPGEPEKEPAPTLHAPQKPALPRRIAGMNRR